MVRHKSTLLHWLLRRVIERYLVRPSRTPQLRRVSDERYSGSNNREAAAAHAYANYYLVQRQDHRARVEFG